MIKKAILIIVALLTGISAIFKMQDAVDRKSVKSFLWCIPMIMVYAATGMSVFE